MTDTSKSNKGRYTKRYLSMRNHPVVGIEKGRALTRNEVWQWICEEAAFKKHQVRLKGKMVWLERAQMPCGRDFLAKEWNWEVKAVRAFLLELERESMIKIVYRSNGHHPNILEVCNYEEYQGNSTGKSPVKSPVLGQRRARGGPDSKKGYTGVEGIEDKNPCGPLRDSKSEIDEAADYVAQQKAQFGLLSEADKREASAKVAAGTVPHEAQEQASAVWDDSGRIEVLNGFRAELLGKLDGTGLTLEDALAEAAGEIGDHLRGIPLQKAVRAKVVKVARWTKSDIAKRQGRAATPASAQRHKPNPDAVFMANQEAGIAISEHLWGRHLVTGDTPKKEPAQ